MRNDVLDYQSPTPRPRRAKRVSILRGTCLGLAATVPAFFASFVYAYGGDYSIAIALYPFAMISTLLTQRAIAWPAITIAILQLPAYGGSIASLSGRGRAVVVAVILMIHLLVALMCFAL